MKFTESPVVELEVGGSRLRFHQNNQSMHVGTSVWPCSLVLVKFAERWSQSPDDDNPYAHLLPDLSSSRAIELGSGCGVAGMGLFLLGLSDILLTDIAPVMPALKHNLKRNKPVLNNKALKTQILYWNNKPMIGAAKPPFDIVIAADVVYIEDTVGDLVGAMWDLLADHGAVLLGYQVRSHEAHLLFWDTCHQLFQVHKVPHGDLHPDYAYEEADVYIMRKKKKETENQASLVEEVINLDINNQNSQGSNQVAS